VNDERSQRDPDHRSLTRRRFLGTVSSGGFASIVGACGRPPAERILPYHEVPPELTPGIAQHYATSLHRQGYATGVLVRSREGRPVKIEGNPDHPASLGGSGAAEQAAIFEVYDPRRLRAVAQQGQPRAASQLQALLQPARDRGAGLRLVLEPTTSPLRQALLQQLLAVRPEAKITFWAPQSADDDVVAVDLFGRPLLVQHDFTRAARVLCLDADVLAEGPFDLRWARDLASRRRVESASSEMSRIWAVGPKPTCTTTFADHHIACRGDEVAAFAAAVVVALGAEPSPSRVRPDALPDVDPGLSSELRARAAEVARDLATSRGECVVVAGPRQPWPVHALAWFLNAQLGAIGRTVWWTEPVRVDPGASGQSLAALVDEMRAGRVRTLLIAGLDPVYAAPRHLGFAEALHAVPDSIACSMFPDATAAACRWSVPLAHDLERWGDARAYDGTLSIVQPLLEPLFGGVSVDELIAMLSGGPPRGAHRLLQEHWAGRWGENWRGRFERALARGLEPDTQAARVSTALPDARIGEALAVAASTPRRAGLEIGWHDDSPHGHTSAAWNPWLQELPDPITKLTWGNAALLGPATADALGVKSGDIVELALADAVVEAPVLVVAEHAEDSVSVQSGYGRPRPLLSAFEVSGPDEPPAARIGFDAGPLRTPDAGGYATGLQIRPTGRAAKLAITQDHMDQLDRELAVAHTLAELQGRGASLTAHLRGPQRRLGLLDQDDDPPQWGMVVDLTLCNGCSACVVACQAENNIVTVGPEQVARGREMHWLRIDRYVRQGPAGPEAVVQPMLCQHCEYAPCEYVCPVNATVHSPDGLNEMVYNRCVGTRFCSNNCPYYVRRFNWFDVEVDETRSLQKNPDVTVRERGVMEKCTYCVQRIRRAQIRAEVEERPLADGDVVTACQQACPTRAIVFGDVSDPGSAVSRQWARPQRYAVLHELGTRPRTQYLARIRNTSTPVSGTTPEDT
jgi:Fe-S-cluster-containing dehydrogenase component